MRDATEREERTPGHAVTIELELEELVGLAGGLREALQVLEEWEFDTRVGMPISEARSLLHALVELSRMYEREIPQT